MNGTCHYNGYEQWPVKCNIMKFADKNKFARALEKYEESLKIYRELARENPRRYEIDYARSLIMGVYLFKEDKNILSDAKKY